MFQSWIAGWMVGVIYHFKNETFKESCKIGCREYLPLLSSPLPISSLLLNISGELPLPPKMP